MKKSKKIFSYIVTFMFICSCFAVSARAENLKIGYINVSKVFDEYKKTKDSDKVLEKETGTKQDRRDKMVNEIKRMRDELDLLSEKGRQQKKEEIEAKVRTLKIFDRDTTQDLRKKRDNMVGDILKEIDQAVKDYAKHNGFDIILNDKVLIYKKDSMDITENILKTLNAKYKR